MPMPISISCANISVFGVIEELEARLGRPVVTSNQAVIWDALELLGWHDRRGCLGAAVRNVRARRVGAPGARCLDAFPSGIER